MSCYRKNVYFKDSEMFQLIMQFLDNQQNSSDTIVYLIEKEIATNGIRNLGNFIPQVRTREYWENYIKENKSGIHSQLPPASVSVPKTKPSALSPAKDTGVIAEDTKEETRAIIEETKEETGATIEDTEEETVIVPSCYE